MVKRLSTTDQNNVPLQNVPAPVNSQDAANKAYVDENAGIASLSQDTTPTLGGDLIADGNRILLSENTILRADETSFGPGMIVVDGNWAGLVASGNHFELVASAGIDGMGSWYPNMQFDTGFGMRMFMGDTTSFQVNNLGEVTIQNDSGESKIISTATDSQSFNLPTTGGTISTQEWVNENASGPQDTLIGENAIIKTTHPESGGVFITHNDGAGNPIGGEVYVSVPDNIWIMASAGLDGTGSYAGLLMLGDGNVILDGHSGGLNQATSTAEIVGRTTALRANTVRMANIDHGTAVTFDLNTVADNFGAGDIMMSIPAEGGTLATQEYILQNFIPYTGGVNDVDLSGLNLNAASGTFEDIVLDTGSGSYSQLTEDKLEFAGAAARVSIGATEDNRLEVRQGAASSIMSKLDVGGLTDARIHTLPDANGTIATQEWVTANSSSGFEPSENLILDKEIAATSTVSQVSPEIHLVGSGWSNDLSAANDVIWKIKQRVENGFYPEGYVDFTIEGAGPGPSTPVSLSRTSLIVNSGSSLKVNNVYESTIDAGVTIDSVLIKDGLVDGKDVSTLADAVHTHSTTDLTATGGTSTSFLRKDNTWATPPNTTYTEITSAEITAGTASTARAISGRRAQEIVDKAVATSQTAIDAKITGVGTSKVTLSTSEPSSPATGDIWIDTDEEVGGGAGVVVQPEEPTETDVLWYDTDDNNAPVSNGNADTVDGFNASATPTANTILPLNSSGKFPSSTLPVSGRVNNGTASTVANPKYQSGFVAPQGNGQINMTIAVTFPEPYASPPVVTTSTLGVKTPVGTAPSSISELNTSISGSAWISSASSITNTGFNLTMSMQGGGTISTSYYAASSWIAIGES